MTKHDIKWLDNLGKAGGGYDTRRFNRAKELLKKIWCGELDPNKSGIEKYDREATFIRLSYTARKCALRNKRLHRTEKAKKK